MIRGKGHPRPWVILWAVCLAMLSLQPAAAQGIFPPPNQPVDDRGRDRDRDRPERVAQDVAVYQGFRAEYVVSGPIAQAGAAEAALERGGAVLVSFRDLEPFDRRVMIFDLRRLDLDGARRRLARAAPDFIADFNHLYRHAQGTPRVYAATLVGDPRQGCRVPQGRRIGLIDGGLLADHPALAGADIIARSALAPRQTPGDTAHGTAVAALIVGEDADGFLNGFAAGARLYAIDAFAQEHSGIAADVDRIGTALTWMALNDVRLINMSFAGPQNEVLADLLEQAEAQGAIMIAAAGNTGQNRALLPASSDAVVAVTAVDAAMRRYPSATRGSHIEFAAPGVDVYVATDGGAGYASGTSYAAPIVTALASRVGPQSVGQLRSILRGRALDLGNPGRDAQYGWGLVRDIGC